MAIKAAEGDMWVVSSSVRTNIPISSTKLFNRTRAKIDWYLRARQVIADVDDPSYLSKICAAIQSFYEKVTDQTLASEQKQAPLAPIEVPANVVEIGERGGTRTLDPMIKSHVLYHLSYALTRRAV
jgi:hypothetical protein